MKTGKIVKQIRTASGLTQAELAEKLGVSPSNVSLIETGKTKFGYAFLSKFCFKMKIPLWQLVRNASDKKDNFLPVKGNKRPHAEQVTVAKLRRVS